MNAILYFDLFAITFLLFLGIGGFKRGFIIEIGRIISLVFTLWLIITRIIIDLIYQIIGLRNAGLLNQVLGFVGGAVKGTIPIILILWAFELLPIQNWTDTLYKESRVANIARTIRDKNIEYFGWKDPVSAGKEYVKSIIDKDSTIQEDDE